MTRKKSSKSIQSQPLFDSERPTLENAELAIPVDPLEDTQRLEPQPPAEPPAPEGREAHDASDETPTMGPAGAAPDAGAATSKAVAGAAPDAGVATSEAVAGEPRDEHAASEAVGGEHAASEAVRGEPGAESEGDEQVEAARELTQVHLRGLLEALVFASDKPMKTGELARLASAPGRQVRDVMGELRAEYLARGIVLDEVAGGWLFRTNAQYAPFVRELAGGRPVKLSRAQLETLAIAAYRQPITRPEIDEIRGVDSGATVKLLLERDLVRILGKKDEPGRPLLYGTTTHFLEFFNMKSLKDLPTLREFTELSDESLRVAEVELGDVLPAAAPPAPRPADREREPDDDDSLRATVEPPPPAAPEEPEGP